MTTPGTPSLSFDLERFRAEFTQTLETPQGSLDALKKLLYAMQQNPNPDCIIEISKTASAALKAVTDSVAKSPTK